jgi:hypothetical protein
MTHRQGNLAVVLTCRHGRVLPLANRTGACRSAAITQALKPESITAWP